MNASNPVLKNPEPDFAALIGVLMGKKNADHVHNIELQIDEEVMAAVYERFLGGKWVPLTPPNKRKYYRQKIDVFHKLGYDGFVQGVWRSDWLNHPPMKSPVSTDTAVEMSRGKREWASEGLGLVTTNQDFDVFPWDKITADYSPYEFMNTNLPEGMKIYAASSVFEHILENLMGYVGLFYNLSDNPALVEAVFNRWGEIVLSYYETVVDFDCVGAFWHTDDLGYKTGTILSPQDLRRYIIPWIKRYAKIAHDHGKPFILHCCGDYFSNGVVEDVIEAGVDVIHSFQDAILPASKAVAEYGKRLGVAGGADMDCLCRLEEPQLRSYLRGILASCYQGRFAYGSGNTVANFVPLENYLIMLDEGRRWSGS